ncbi:MAG: hypothetical protein ACPF9I_04275 [Candidatus Thalassarchaeaceae archaeon]
MTAPSDGLFSAILILIIPVLLTVPLRVLWSWWIGNEPEHLHYREKFTSVIDSGYPIRDFRHELDRTARQFEIDLERQTRIETDMLHPLDMRHFLLVPSLVVWPVLSIPAGFVFIPLIPVTRFFEWILIEKKVLLRILLIVKSLTGWDIVWIDRPGDPTRPPEPVIAAIHRLPITVLLGVFAYLIVSYLSFSFTTIAMITIGLYVILVAAISIIRAATSGSLVFIDARNRKVIPSDTFVEQLIGPWVGVGLIFLLSRQIALSSTIRDGSLSDPSLFAMTVVLVLYIATLIGISLELSFFRTRGKAVGVLFESQVEETLSPDDYSLIRHLGKYQLVDGRKGRS